MQFRSRFVRLSQERQGELFILAESFLWAWLPILTILTYSALAPLWSLLLSTFIAACFFAVVLYRQNRLGELFCRAAWQDLGWASFWIMMLFVLYFAGLEHTTAGNAAVILFMQVLFAFVYFNLFKKEPIAPIHLLGVALMSMGAVLILFPGRWEFNPGDWLVLLAAMSAPVANRYQQRARRYVSAQTILFVRSALSLPLLWLLATAFSTQPFAFGEALSVWPLILINGLVLMGASKIFWVEGLHRIALTKASALTAVGPLFTLFFAWWVLGESPALLQWIGMVPILAGGILITQKVAA
ncbi:MAG: DMT family transporter [Campylobacterales bacterium]